MQSLRPFTLVALLAALSIGSVSAQDNAADRDAIPALAARQIVESLESPLAMVRNQTLKNVVVYSTLHRDRVDLSSAVSMIAELAGNDDFEANRRLAVAALRSMDSFRANRYLSELDAMDDDEYRSLISGVLSEYNQTRSSGSL